MPQGLVLAAGAKTTALSDLELLGGGMVGAQGPAQLWKARGIDFLEPSAMHTLTMNAASGPIELTRFTTAAGYDKVQGTPPTLRSLELWRVRYPLTEINSGNCVFAEYHGFVRFEYDPASIPNTSPESTVNFMTLVPKTGGSPQVFYFTGDSGYQGESPLGDTHRFAPWRPELDPTREYCAWLTTFGDGDLARLPVTSARVCAAVNSLSSDDADAGASGADAAMPPPRGDAALPDDAGAGEPAPHLVKGCSCRLISNSRGRSYFPLIAAIFVSMLIGRRRSRRHAPARVKEARAVGGEPRLVRTRGARL